MRRNHATLAWTWTTPCVVALVLVASCSSPKPETASVASAKTTEPAVTSSAPSQPAPPPAATNPPVSQGEPTPAETPLPPPAPPSTEAAPVDPKAKAAEADAEALKWMEQQEAKRAEYQQSLVKLQTDRDAAKEVLAKAERDLLAFKNPYLARPVLAPEQTSEIQGMNGVDRVKWAEGRVADAKAVLEAAQKAYDDAKANPPPD